MAGTLALDGAQELKEFAATVASVHIADDGSGGDIQGRKQRGRAMTLVVVGAPFGEARCQRKHRLRAVQGLDLINI